jgi:dephospho-CoA kinase
MVDMLKVGLTGSIAVGKTHVVAVLKDLGCVVFDADKLAHAVMEPGQPAYDEVIREFGSEVVGPDAAIDRTKLGAIVFSDDARRKRLNEIVHPRVKDEQDRLLREAEGADPNGIAVVDAALMIESGGYKRFDKLIVVFCDRESQVRRLMARNAIGREEAEQRISAQMPSEEKRRYADYEIDTSGSYDDTRQRTVEVHRKLMELASLPAGAKQKGWN